MLLKYSLIFVIILFTQPSFAQTTKNLHWKILQAGWNPKYETDYQNFIHNIGMARKNGKCTTTDQCLKNPIANPMYYKKNPTSLKSIFSDCADLPFILRAYFSWMNDLPFTYPTDLIEAKNFSQNLQDIRYSKYGNIITEKSFIKNGENINDIFQSITDSISTASFRTNAATNDFGKLFRDTYPIEIDQKVLVPGTILYDANGHVAIVYDVTTNGKIHLIDAHPDNSLTTLIYGEKFARTNVKIGGGFSNFRPFSVIKNVIYPVPNKDLSGYSLIQFQKGPFIYRGETLTFYEYVRKKLADDINLDPIAEFKEFMDELCQDIKYREAAVNLSLNSNIQNLKHPKILPENIYGTDGEWETFASPSRDARLKASVREGKEFLIKVIQASFNNIFLNYSGENLVPELREIYLNKSQSCQVHVNQNTIINLDFILKNLFALSFDPYHCPELRWGIINSETCPNNSNKVAWYEAEQGLRNRIDRDYSIKTNYEVDSLSNAPASQVEKPDLDYAQLLEIIRY